ncbi:hypothetical protein EFS14_02315 [Lentilactobacillus buchneri]|nr:hypothetical protein [Lentilactobacillus buchneri]MCT3546622.1 hypothetical protein [Lentilactobacillus buchneri]MCT4437215.1 hypothetical protein [Lentilactobacillus buchneri]
MHVESPSNNLRYDYNIFNHDSIWEGNQACEFKSSLKQKMASSFDLLNAYAPIVTYSPWFGTRNDYSMADLADASKSMNGGSDFDKCNCLLD